MKKLRRVFAAALSACVLAAGFAMPTYTAEGDTFVVGGKTVKVGDYFEMGTYLDEPILWRCIAYDENGPLMLSDKILCMKAFDAAGESENGSHKRSLDQGHIRKANGSNYWGDSNLKDWLNSDADAGKVVWSCGNPPDAEHLKNGYMAYDKEAGFLNTFTSGEKSAIKTVKQKQILDRQEYSEDDADNYHKIYSIEVDYATIYPVEYVLQNYDTAFCEYSDDRVFLLDVKQVYDLYTDLGDYIAAEPTQAAVKDARKNGGLSMAYVHEWSYWLRTPSNFGKGGCNVRVVHQRTDAAREKNTYSISNSLIANDGFYGVRPAFYLDQNVSISYGSGAAGDPYGINRTKPVEPTTQMTTKATTTVTTTQITTEKTTEPTTKAVTTQSATEKTTKPTTSSGKTFAYGDADGDGKVMAGDATYILQKVLVSTFKMPIEGKTSDWLKYTDVDGDKKITAGDATYVLQKTLVSTFEFPVEKKK